MFGVDLREPEARVDRVTSQAEGPRDEWPSRAEAWRLTTLVLACVLVGGAWASDRAGGARGDGLPEVAASGFLPPGLPLQVNARVERWIEEFQTTRREEFAELLERRGVFEDLIRSKLRERGLPEDLVYLAMIESGLSPLAVSRVSAVGLWQFMDPTARQLGLRVDEYVDERRDPVRATDAALDYLEALYERFGSWYLAAAAYNAGPGRVERVLALHADGRTGDEELYWEVLGHLPRETREYVPRLVAATILANDAEALGFDPSAVPAYEYELVFVPGGTRLEAVAAALREDVQVLRELNPHLVREVTPPGEIYGLRVPPGGTPAVVASLVRRPLDFPAIVD
jgi:membrane-bound lytic murein transglycosylase D